MSNGLKKVNLFLTISNDSMNYKTIIILVTSLLLTINAFSQNTYTQYQPITIDFEIESTNEMASENPFTDYRLNVTFSHNGKHYDVPGFYAADGDAANTSADK
ncbi:MAG: DUF5060 domain-containing protein, partial [Bacteroidetes bacterium]|nr:DUF5060 domain-containing protein [Bacteroidota bacterium]